MEVNLTDWLGDNSWAIWLSLAFLLGIAEIMSLDLVLIMLAVGALAGAVVACWRLRCGGCRSWPRPPSASACCCC